MRLGITRHAAVRYQERVKPCLDLETAKAELQALVDAAGAPTDVKPDWHVKAQPESRYLLLSDGIAATVKGNAVLTILTRASEATDARAYKRERKKKKRDERRRKHQIHTRNGRSEAGRRKEATWE